MERTEQSRASQLVPRRCRGAFPHRRAEVLQQKIVVGNTYDGYGGLTPGIQWVTEFIDAYTQANKRAPRLSGIGVHCYEWTAAECIETTRQFVQLASQVGAEVWVTEFAFFRGWNGERTTQQVDQEMQTYLAYLKGEPRVTRYAWFASRIAGTESWANPPGWNSPLLDMSGNLTGSGTSYAQ